MNSVQVPNNNYFSGSKNHFNQISDMEPISNDCEITLKNADLWKKFHELQTEMIITKSGRRMFPSLHVQLQKLDPNATYCIFLEMVPASKCRYRYSHSGGWAPAGTEEAQSPQRIYVHPESPATGEYWMSKPVSFGRMKLTNTISPPIGHIVLSSMHKYQPRITIVKTSDIRNLNYAPSVSKEFVETQFIAVTAYQNDRITKLKIDHNPFAKGFRENGQSKCKRKRNSTESANEDKDSPKKIKTVVKEEIIDVERTSPSPVPEDLSCGGSCSSGLGSPNDSSHSSYGSPSPVHHPGMLYPVPMMGTYPFYPSAYFYGSLSAYPQYFWGYPRYAASVMPLPSSEKINANNTENNPPIQNFTNFSIEKILSS